jgi:hypothetical protein
VPALPGAPAGLPAVRGHRTVRSSQAHLQTDTTQHNTRPPGTQLSSEPSSTHRSSKQQQHPTAQTLDDRETNCQATSKDCSLGLPQTPGLPHASPSMHSSEKATHSIGSSCRALQ